MADRSAPQLSLTLAEDKRTMDLTINGDGKLLPGIVLSAEQLDQMLGALTALRGHMSPEFPTEFGPETPVRPIKGTHFDFDGEAKELIFALRDPGFGWLSQRFGVGLLERMLRIARSLEKRVAVEDGAKR